MHMLASLAALIAPHECLRCGAEGTLLCSACQHALPPSDPCCYRCGTFPSDGQSCVACLQAGGLAAVVCRTSYDDLAKELIHALKFERKQAAAVPVAEMMAITCAPLTPDCIVPLPTATKRVRTRGYDQAEQIARHLALQLDVPYASLLRRVGQQRQVGQSKATRRQQASGAFRLASGTQRIPEHILLIDDVLTTGASLEAAARVLLAAGARRVSAATFAAA